jgi:hypothetical protein
MRICVDLDKTLCVGQPYIEAVPFDGAADFLTGLKRDGHTIILYTARGMGRNNGDAGRAVADIGLITLRQLEEWGFVYDEIYFGKPAADLYIDDKALLAVSYEKLQKQISQAETILKHFDDDNYICNKLNRKLEDSNYG